MIDWLPSLNALRAFESVARHLNYQNAADELHVTPAAVKQLVRKLEDTLGVKLLQRKGRGLELTSKGVASLNDLSKAMKHMSAAVDKMRPQSTQKRLIVTVEASFATAWLVPRLESFRQKHPDVNVLIESSQQIVDLHHSEIDIAIRYGFEPDSSLQTRRIFDDRIFPACSPALAKGPPPVRYLDQLNVLPLIHWDMSQLTWAHEAKKWFSWNSWINQLGASGIQTTGGAQFSDYGLAMQAAIAGQGFVLASWPTFQDAFDAGLLVRPFTEVLTADYGYDVITTNKNRQKSEVNGFIDWILQEAEQSRKNIPKTYFE